MKRLFDFMSENPFFALLMVLAVGTVAIEITSIIVLKHPVDLKQLNLGF